MCWGFIYFFHIVKIVGFLVRKSRKPAEVNTRGTPIWRASRVYGSDGTLDSTAKSCSDASGLLLVEFDDHGVQARDTHELDASLPRDLPFAHAPHGANTVAVATRCRIQVSHWFLQTSQELGLFRVSN